MQKYDLSKCPCGSGRSYAECCEGLHSGTRQAETPLDLLRGRYTAYALLNGDYIKASWHPDYCPNMPARLMVADYKKIKLTGLIVIREEITGDRGVVEYQARLRIGARFDCIHEIANYVKTEGKWYYTDGELVR